jgi:coenzyme Q-binding protein COQ10
MFDLASDIERYPEFLKGWISAHIRKREGNTCYVDQVMGVGPMQVKFSSTAILERPTTIEVTSTDPPFRTYRLSWTISARPTGCQISVEADFELESALMQRMLSPFLRAAIDDAVAAFEARAHALYAPQKPS